MTRCSIIPVLKANHRHHTSYAAYGRDRFANTIPVSQFAHWLIHGVLGGTVVGGVAPVHAVELQNKMAKCFPRPLSGLLWYPNPFQRVVHLWARLPVLVKAGIVLYLVAMF